MIIDNKEIKGIIFDLDGTLFDSCKVWKKIDIEFFKMMSLELPADYSKEIAHLGLSKAANYTKNRFNLSLSEEEIVAIWDKLAIFEYTNNIKLKPYAYDLLKKCKDEGLTLAVATANSDKYYMPCLKKNGILSFFDHIYDLSKTKEGKNSPEIYLRVAKEMNLNPSEIAVFEDIPTALKAASGAGFVTVAVDDDTEVEYIEEKKTISNLFIESFEELI